MSGRGRGRGARGGERGSGDGGRGDRFSVPIRQSSSAGDSRHRGGRGGGLFDNRGGRGAGDRGRGAPGGRGGGVQVFRQTGETPTTIQGVILTENAIAKGLAAQSGRTSNRLPLRPGYGTRGEKILLYANYFELSVKKKQPDLFRYNIELVHGSQATGRKLKQVIKCLMEEHFQPHLRHIATDYKSIIISQVSLQNDDERIYDIQYRKENEDEPQDPPVIYHLKVQATGRLSTSELLDHLSSTNASSVFGSKAEVIQALNIVAGQHAKSTPGVASIGANKHFDVQPQTAERYNLSAGLEALRGFFVSARVATARLLLNVQVKYAACYQPGQLQTLMLAYRKERSNDLRQLDSFLSKLRVSLTHIQRRNRRGEPVPRIKAINALASPGDGRQSAHPPRVARYGAGPNDVEFWVDESTSNAPQPAKETKKKGKKGSKAHPAPAPQGPTEAGRYVSVADYFQRRYNVTVNPNIPVVNLGNRQNPSYHPAEVCVVEPGQPASAKLTSDQTRRMLEFAVRNPSLNAESIVSKGASVLGFTPQMNACMTSFGLHVSPQLITVPARVLPAPNVLYQDMKASSNLKPALAAFGSWNMKSIKFSKPAQLKSWVWVYINYVGQRPAWSSADGLRESLNALTSKLNEVGVQNRGPVGGIKLDLNHTDVASEKIEDGIKSLMSKYQPVVILTILPSKDTELYNTVKTICDTRLGVRNICVLTKGFAKPGNDQFLANVGLKFNLKLGGTNQSLERSKLGIIGEGNTMVVGFDVTHPAPQNKSAPSVAGMVSSIDRNLGQWPAVLRVQQSRQEMIADLDSMLQLALRRWAANNNKKYPENIIVYRDGVSEGQYDIVLQQELPLLKKACEKVYSPADTKKGLPKCSIVIVGKRHHTRFYPTKEADADRSSNPKNGTVVDRGVTEARDWDFYLQAHTALQGTARPAHYFTIWDEIFHYQKPKPPFENAADILEDLTHNMCYMFGRATKAVSICPPAYYADLVCERARCYLSHVFDPSIPNTPSGSIISGSAGRPPAAEGLDVEIHPNVRDTMFYI